MFSIKTKKNLFIKRVHIIYSGLLGTRQVKLCEHTRMKKNVRKECLIWNCKFRFY